MSVSELGILFPIILVAYNPHWEKIYLEEQQAIQSVIDKKNIIRINHCGSTAVPNLIAKPTIDILLELAENTDLELLKKQLEKMGYLYTEKRDNPPPHLMFMKGYSLDGFVGQAFHIHVRYSGDWDELYFRDYLLLYSDLAKEYGELKLKLQEQFPHDREAYTNGKASFIKAITKKARIELTK